jgi:hypothetical protein
LERRGTQLRSSSSSTARRARPCRRWDRPVQDVSRMRDLCRRSATDPGRTGSPAGASGPSGGGRAPGSPRGLPVWFLLSGIRHSSANASLRPSVADLRRQRQQSERDWSSLSAC